MPKLKKNIEVEIRSFISKQKYNQLLKFFKKNGKFLGKDFQITYYFSGIPDLRIQKNNKFSKIWLKKGRIHDKFREEIEVRFNRQDFEKIKNIFLSLGFKEDVVWLRRRNDFLWKGIKVSVDFTKGYGHIIELEKITSEKNKKKIHQLLIKKLDNLGIKMTPKKIFDRQFNYYRKNWRKILKINHGK